MAWQALLRAEEKQRYCHRIFGTEEKQNGFEGVTLMFAILAAFQKMSSQHTKLEPTILYVSCK
jgi:hypothetical protein